LLERVAAAAPQSWLSLVPAPTDVPCVVQVRAPDDAELALGRAAVYVLLDVDGSGTVRDLAARHGLLRVLKALVRLREVGLVTFESRPPAFEGDSGGAPPGRAFPSSARLAPSGRAFPSSARLPPPGNAIARDLAAPSAGWRDRLTRGRPFAIGVELAQAVVVTGLMILGIRALVENFRVEGTSMQPNFAGGQALVVNRAAYFHVERLPFAQVFPTTNQGSTRYIFGGPQRGDVVVFRAPPQPDADYIKRIIGLPGDTILITQGRVFINGERLDEPYVDFPASYSFPTDGQPALVPDGNYFVLGDNRPDSFDSHLWGFVPVEDLIGRAWLRYWPPDELSVLQPLAPVQASAAVAVR
jgi:signal peptidase I